VIRFGAPPVTTAIGAPGKITCYRFYAVGGTEGDWIRLQLAMKSGDLSPKVEVVRPDGITWCSAP